MLNKDLKVEDLYKDVEEIPKDIRFLALGILLGRREKNI
jgi:hypothetical protein